MSTRQPPPNRRVPPPPSPGTKPISHQNTSNSISVIGQQQNDVSCENETGNNFVEDGQAPPSLARRRSSMIPPSDSPSAALAAVFANMQVKNQPNPRPPGPQRNGKSFARAAVPPLPPRKSSAEVSVKPDLTGNSSKSIDINGSNIGKEADVGRLIARRPPPPPRPVPNGPVVPSRVVPTPPRLPARNVPLPPPPRPTLPPPSLTGRPPVPIPVEYGTCLDEDGEIAESLEQVPELPSRRRLPPMPTRRATPPPPVVNLSTKPKVPAAPPPVPLVPSHYASRESSCIKCRDFSEVDYHASLFPRHAIMSLQTLAHDLTSPFPTQTEKARAIFTWLHYNIIYDVEAFMAGNIQPSTPESTLRSGLAVCDGFAGFFVHLASLSELEEVYKVTGHGKGVGYRALEEHEPIPPPNSNHAWNCILLDGEWRLIDSCWGAGALMGSSYNQRFEPFWFTADPIEFGGRHFPIEDPGYQLIPDEMGGPISWEEYITQPERPTIYGPFDEQGLDILTLEPPFSVIEGGGMVTFSVYKRCEHMSTTEADNYIFIISTGDTTRTRMSLNGMGGWSATVHVPRGTEMSLYYVTVLGNKKAFGVTVKEYDWAVGRQGMEFGGLARWRAA